ncbi:MB12B-like protein [Mya arenaria]|uniref:MB12B-like protein n=1 Tax=Mya arenaria TaxID=6604 RepID=A0ABY7EYP5_MYAAR|nr:MB12B-like protein [Mya arenaria]
MAVICGRCLKKNHLNCENQLVDLVEVSHPSTDRLNDIIHGLEDLLIDAKCLQKNVNISRENNNSAKENNFKAVRDFRKDIDDYFDKLQREIEHEITQCHANKEDIYTEQLKTSFVVEDTVLIKQQQLDSMVQQNLKSTLYVATDNLGKEIASLNKTLIEAARKPMNPMYEFQTNDVFQNLMSTHNIFGTVEDIPSGSDELTHTITRKHESDQATIDGGRHGRVKQCSSIRHGAIDRRIKIQRPAFKTCSSVITAVVVVAGIGNCPSGYTPIKHDFDFKDACLGRDEMIWRSPSRYLCVKRAEPKRGLEVLVDVSITNVRDPVPAGFTVVDTLKSTNPSSGEMKKKLLCVCWMNASITMSAISDIFFLRRCHRKLSKEFIMVG